MNKVYYHRNARLLQYMKINNTWHIHNGQKPYDYLSRHTQKNLVINPTTFHDWKKQTNKQTRNIKELPQSYKKSSIKNPSLKLYLMVKDWMLSA